MRFDDWTAEAKRSLDEWNPDERTAPHERDEAHELRRPRAQRILLSAAAAVVLIAGAAGVVSIMATEPVNQVDTQGFDIASSPQGSLPDAGTAPQTSAAPTALREREQESGGPFFSCSPRSDVAANDLNPSVMETAPHVATWHLQGTQQGEPLVTGVYPVGELVAIEAESSAELLDRAREFVDAVSQQWLCTVTSSVVYTSEEPVMVDAANTAINRLGGACYVADASTDADSVHGVSGSLATALAAVEAMRNWDVVLADDGGNGQGPGQLWLNYSFEADANPPDQAEVAAVLDAVTQAVVADADVRGVEGECWVH